MSSVKSSAELSSAELSSARVGERRISLELYAPDVTSRRRAGRRPPGGFTPHWNGAELSLALRRDLWGRRIWAEWRRRTVRVLALLGGDVAAMLSATVIASTFTRTPLPSGGAIDLLMGAILGQALFGTYGAGQRRTRVGRLLAGLAVGILGTLVLRANGAPLPAACVTLAWMLGGCEMILARFGIDASIRMLERRGVGTRTALIIGTVAEARRIVEHFHVRGETSVRFLGVLSPRPEERQVSLGTLDELVELLEQLDIEHVFASDSISASGEFRPIAAQCLHHGVTVSVVAGIDAWGSKLTTYSEIAGWPALELEVPRSRMLQVAIKRLIDITLGSIAVIALAPVFVMVALAVKLEDGGPVFFRQRRPGLGGRPFGMLKFRSMRPNAEEMLRRDPMLHRRYIENACKLPPAEDPRLTRIGRFLRATSLDELPQFLNVLHGDMSLVGPRPAVGPELEEFGESAAAVLSVKPGITGHWQVSGRSNIAVPERARLDREYVERWSLLFDLRILLRTVPAVLRRTGAH